MNIQHIMACRCGREETVDADQMNVGAVWRCPACGEYTARVRARDGRTEWVVLDTGYADWLRLCDEPEDEEEAA
ncbi:hypothetical protein [Aurantimonas coralicida]|uniref:hypothetical protein n=1 Tax=Aurantimonas coralicida TaxID=182270 RepID=UPI000421A131|nr:hypothetical protein [Aurantimonas coralicida]